MAYIITTAWRLKARRKMLGFTTTQVALLAEVSQGLISHLENERVETPRKETQEKISKALNCDRRWLFDGLIIYAPAGFYKPAYPFPKDTAKNDSK